MGFLDLFSVATMPVLEVLLITALGAFLALDSVDILRDNARKHMNTIVFFVFSPAVVGGYLAKTITFESLILLWFMPLNILFTFIIGTALGWILLKITKAPQHLKGLVISSCSAANLGNLPLILIPAICKQKGSPFGAPEICHTYGMSYASLGMAIGAVYLWSYVYNIVRISSSSTQKEAICSNISVDSKKVHSKISETLEDNCAQPLLPQEDRLDDTFDDEEEAPFFVKMKQHFKKFQRNINLKALLAPSTIGAIIGFTVGVVPLLRKSMIGRSAPLHVIEDAAILLGDSAIPAQTLIVGANLIKGLKGSGIKPSLVIGIIIIRYLFLPLFGIVIVKEAIRFGMVQSDPLYQFVLLLQYALPPALNIGTITQLFGKGESECSVIMLWTYAFASISLTLWSTYFMWLVA